MPHRFVTILAVALLATSAGCKKKKVETVDTTDRDDGVVSVDQTLAVASVSPSLLQVGTPTNVSVRGGGFRPDAKVLVGPTAAGEVKVNSASVLTAVVPGLAAGTYDVTVTNPDGKSATLYQALTVSAGTSADCGSVTVYFDFDSSALGGEATSRLSDQLTCWSGSSATVDVEGHCDERGTLDYNLALGERRAASVASWLSSRGIERSRLNVVSYGENRPVDPGHDAKAWAANRRSEVKLKR